MIVNHCIYTIMPSAYASLSDIYSVEEIVIRPIPQLNIIVCIRIHYFYLFSINLIKLIIKYSLIYDQIASL